MIKIILRLVLFFSLLSCGNPVKFSTQNPVIQDRRGSGVLPDLDPLTEEYSPLGLNDKVIVLNKISHAPMDLISQNLILTFDPINQTVRGQSIIKFKLKKSGRPYFELQSPLTSIRLNTFSVSASSLKDPDGENQSYWSVDQKLSPGSVHELELEYQLPAGRVTFTNGGVRFLTDMTDLNGKFFEYWGPVGFEGDAFALNLELKVNNTESVHTLFTNGKSSVSPSQSWKIIFPDYFSKSSFYVHLTNLTGLTIKKFVYQGLEKDIPVEVYGTTASLVNSAVSQLPKLFAELEGDYGAYAHEKFVAYMNDRSGGMEYVGATITSLGSLDHELLHSWFARSVIPADGRSGWIDEAMASWRDYGYTQAKSTLQRTPTNLANFSSYRKSTPSNSYVDGRALMAELDLEFESFGGLKPVMRAFFKKYKNQVVTNEEFWDFLHLQTNLDVEPFNLRYAMGEAEESMEEDGASLSIKKEVSKHPDPLTEKEVLRLR